MEFLPLSAHCLDVALCFRTLCLIPAFGRVLARAATRKLTDRDLDRLAVLALLHDLGKANRGFQNKVFVPKAPRAGHVRELAPVFDDPELSQRAMSALDWELLSGWFCGDEIAYSYFMAAFSHHGRPVEFKGERTGVGRLARAWWQPDGDLDPMAAVSELMAAARRAFPGAFEPGGEPLPVAPQFHHRFAGLVMLADWLGSHPHWFPIEPVGIEERLKADLDEIPRLLRAVGFDSSVYHLETKPFAERFEFTPRPLQALIDGLDPDDDDNRLLIAESETGSGKTEAALHWFGKLFAAGRVDSLYFALPTRVAARELYRRVVATIERWFPEPDARPVTVLAVPGYAEVDGLAFERRLPDSDEANRWTDDEEQRRYERCWAAEHPKRFLAATVAVGTIDQALLSAVQSAHAHLRSVCLDRSLLVVDEVHASDTYMSRLLQHLLHHHLSVGGQAMLLSATLGSVARQMYVAAASGAARPLPLDEAIAVPYPTLTDATGTLITATDARPEVASAETKGKIVAFEPLPIAQEPEQIIGRLINALRGGARVLVVTNTVDRANRLLRAAEAHAEFDSDWLFSAGGVACPHHGRFAPADRALLDAAVSKRLGKNSAGDPLLLIGTQTLEQSLDIDADLLVTDLAPADVLLQRIGRLHRHERPRPEGFAMPQCLLLVPDRPLLELLDEKGNLVGEYKGIGYGSVYPDLRILALTLAALEKRPHITIPEHNRWLVEQATHPDQLEALTDPRWQAHGQSITGEELMKALQAGTVTADFSRLFGQFSFNESGGKVATRLGADSWRLPLDRPVASPFGQELQELLIPGHMAPKTPEESLQVEAVDETGLTLRCGDRRYRYTRFGLELEKETS